MIGCAPHLVSNGLMQTAISPFNGWGVQTLRTGDRQGLQPVALPEVDYRLRLTDPILGGKVQLQANSLVIGRTAGQDTQRAFASARWDLRKLTGMGQEG
jgi:LPS-assembly protein